MEKVNKKVVIGIIILVVVLILSVVGYKVYKYFNSNEYHLKKLGYNQSEISSVIKMEKSYIETILTLDYDENIVPLFKEKYFILKNLNKYLDYQKKNKDKKYTDIVAIVNVGADKNWYDESVATNMEKENLILVNKFNYLAEGYKPEDLVNMSLQYAFNGKQIRTEVNDSFKQMAKAAKEENLTVVANSTFRTFEYQNGLYTRYKNDYGKEYADNYAARPGYSEHQTGLAIDVSTLNSTMENFESTNEFKWLQENAHKYGFILRYPKDKEYITGYKYESWHYRYVGVKYAKKIKESGLTFDEYYAYYLNK